MKRRFLPEGRRLRWMLYGVYVSSCPFPSQPVLCLMQFPFPFVCLRVCCESFVLSRRVPRFSSLFCTFYTKRRGGYVSEAATTARYRNYCSPHSFCAWFLTNVVHVFHAVCSLKLLKSLPCRGRTNTHRRYKFPGSCKMKQFCLYMINIFCHFFPLKCCK